MNVLLKKEMTAYHQHACYVQLHLPRIHSASVLISGNKYKLKDKFNALIEHNYYHHMSFQKEEELLLLQRKTKLQP